MSYKPQEVFNLQDQLLLAKKDFANKDNQWKRERMLLIQKNQMMHMEIIELRQRQSHLKKINETLSAALAQLKTSDNYSDNEEIKFNDTDFEQLFKQQKHKCEKQKQELTRDIKEKLHAEIQINLTREFEDKFAKRIKNEKEKLDKELRLKYAQQIDKLKQQNSRLEAELFKIHNHVRMVESQIADSKSQIRSSCASSYYEKTKPECISVATDLLCEVCNSVYSANVFYQHLEQCRRDQFNEYQELLARKNQILQQLQKIQDAEGPKKKITSPVVVIMDKNNKKQIRSIMESLCINTNSSDCSSSIMKSRQYSDDQHLRDSLYSNRLRRKPSRRC